MQKKYLYILIFIIFILLFIKYILYIYYIIYIYLFIIFTLHIFAMTEYLPGATARTAIVNTARDISDFMVHVV